MRHCISRFALTVFLALGLTIPLCAQSARGAAPQAQQAQTPNPQQSEKQPPLDVDRDPVVSPDAQDNEPVSPGHPGGARGVALQRGEKGRFTLTRNVNEVVLNVSVFDQGMHMVNGLTKDDFTVSEDGVPQTIAAFQHQDVPVSMGILVDNSGSMRDKRPAVNEAALDLVRASNPDDEAFIVNFSDTAFIDTYFTSSIAKLRDGLSHIDSRGGTALYDAVVASADYLESNAKRSKEVLLVITDGVDNASSEDLQQTIEKVQGLEGPVVYSIGLMFGAESDARESHRAKRALNLLSQETGGLAFFPKTLEDVDPIAAEVAHDIRSQYTISYHSTKPMSEPGFRTVKVEAHAKGYRKLIVRTKTGYYPKQEPQSKPAAIK
ncbi:MAG TPA: VWA domain-containing protein [Acidobacteriaceae bacterium]|nr:VWA domain-containing protein [Acidobacteriaceae bacterium]